MVNSIGLKSIWMDVSIHISTAIPCNDRKDERVMSGRGNKKVLCFIVVIDKTGLLYFVDVCGDLKITVPIQIMNRSFWLSSTRVRFI